MANRNLFDAENAFFVIDSESLSEVSTRLYGYTIINDTLIEDGPDLGNAQPVGDGAYVYVYRKGDRITITQDYIGSFGIYLFREQGYFALSNSFLLLVEHLKTAHKITFNRDYANYLLSADLCSAAFGETMINEIEMLDRCTSVVIDISAGTLDFEYTDYMENTVELSSEEGMNILDSWYSKWTGLIRSLHSADSYIHFDLTGGFDSRMVFNLLCGSGIDINTIFVKSATDGLHTHSEDFAIASEIGKHYGFELNTRHGRIPPCVNYTVDDAMNISFYLKLGFHKQMYQRIRSYSEPVHYFGGSGGECVRSYWNSTEEEYIQDAVKFCRYVSADMVPAVKASTRKVLTAAFDRIREKYARFGRCIAPEDMCLALYRETRCRNHFGKDLLENYFGGQIKYAPLLDRELHRLKLSDRSCRDNNLLPAVIFDRYNSELLGFRFDSGRTIDPKTIMYAKELNRRFPVKPVQTSNLHVCNDVRPRCRVFPENDNPPITLEMTRVPVKDIFYSAATKNTFTLLYSYAAYLNVCREVETRAYHPLENAYTVIGISKIMQDVLINAELRSRTIADSFRNELGIPDVRELEEFRLAGKKKLSTAAKEKILELAKKCYRSARLCFNSISRAAKR